MKKLYILIVTIVSLSILVSCSSDKNEATNDALEKKIDNKIEKPENPIHVKEDKGMYNKDLANIFSQQKGYTAIYSGLLDYGHVTTVNRTDLLNGVLTIDLEGYMEDGMGRYDEEGNERKFLIEYEVTKDMVKEKYYSKETNQSSISNELILFKAPLVEGNSWEQTFIYKGEQYVGTTTITKVSVIEGDTGEVKRYKTNTIIGGIEGFKDNRYIETREYEEGKGLIKLTRSLEGYKENGKMEYFPFDFGYELVDLNKEDNDTESKEETTDTNVEATINDFFYTNRIKELHYSGILDYGYVIKFLERKSSGTKMIYNYKGEMADGMGPVGPDGEDRTFNVKYTFDGKKLKEEILNNEDGSNVLNSIIPNKIVLQEPIEVGNEWQETFRYNNVEYIANSKITAVSEVNEDAQVFVETKVLGISDYKNETYIENRIFQEGIGLISFKNSIPSYVNEETGDTEYFEFDFSYQFVAEQKIVEESKENNEENNQENNEENTNQEQDSETSEESNEN